MINEKLYAQLSIDKKIFINSIKGILSQALTESLIFWGLGVILAGKLYELNSNYEVFGYFSSAIYYYLLFTILCFGAAFYTLFKYKKKNRELEENIIDKYFEIKVKK